MPNVEIVEVEQSSKPHRFMMCCDNKCLFFIKVRTGSLIFGYVSAVLTAIEILVSIGLTFNIFTLLILTKGMGFNAGVLYMLQVFTFEAIAGFTFSVLLLYGITENKPVLVKAYVIFGMIQLALMLVTVIILFELIVPVGILGLFVCVIYTLIIYMVYLTHKIMVTETAAVRSFSNPPNLLMA